MTTHHRRWLIPVFETEELLSLHAGPHRPAASTAVFVVGEETPSPAAFLGWIASVETPSTIDSLQWRVPYRASEI